MTYLPVLRASKKTPRTPAPRRVTRSIADGARPGVSRYVTAEEMYNKTLNNLL